MSLDKQKKSIFIRRLKKWHKGNHRDYPWRRTKNPYYIAVAELLLQKTNADKVVTVYRNMVEAYPHPSALAGESIERLQGYFSKIGIKSRAKTLKEIGYFFSNAEHLSTKQIIQIDGVGAYIANAIAIHAYNRRLPLLDTNIIRIHSRIFGLNSRLKEPRKDKALWVNTKELLPNKNVSAYYYALLDFGAIVCTARKENCKTCVMGKDLCLDYSLQVKHPFGRIAEQSP